MSAQWEATRPGATTALVPRKIPGGPVVKVSAQVWRGRIWRDRPGQRQPQWDTCPHNHTKQAAAAQCGERAAKRLNRLAAKAHEPWPAENTLRCAKFPLPRLTEDKVNDRLWPLTAECQPCGKLITSPAKGEPWVHEEVQP